MIHTAYGPSCLQSLIGKRWFITFIDDHTNYMAMSLEEKNEAKPTFKSFYQMIQNQSNVKIQVL